MKINFENNDYTLKVSWYKNDKRICVYLENAEETLNITNNDSSINIKENNLAFLDSFVIESGLIETLKEKKIINNVYRYEFFDVCELNFDTLISFDPTGMKEFLSIKKESVLALASDSEEQPGNAA